MKEMTEQELMDLKEEIEETKTKVSELTGKQQYLKKQLSDMQIQTIKDARGKLKDMVAEISRLSADIQSQTKAIKEKYNV